MTHEEKQIHNAVHAELREFEEFKELVKRMRDTQQDVEMMERFAYQWTIDDHLKYEVFLKDKAKKESEVDEYLKKTKNIDRRMALEAENTEFDYGHNVKHCSED